MIEFIFKIHEKFIDSFSKSKIITQPKFFRAKLFEMSVFDFGVDLWIELIILNDLSNQDVFNLTTTCKFFSQLLKKEKLLHFVEDRQIHFGKYKHQDNQSRIESVGWSHDNQLIASGDYKGKIYIWNVKNGALNKILKKEDDTSIWCLRFHPHNANLLAVGRANSLSLWNIEENKIEMNFEGFADSICQMQFDPQGRLLVSCGENPSVQVWKVETGKCEQTLPANLGMCSLEFTNDGQYLGALSFTSRAVFIWKVDTFQLVQKIVQQLHLSVFQFFNDNKTFALIASKDKKVQFYDFLSGIEKSEMSFETKMNYHFSFDLHPNQNIVCFGGEMGFEIWDLQSKKLLAESDETSLDLSFSPNGKALAIVLGAHIQVFDMKKYL